jgi:hypothetical protein
LKAVWRRKTSSVLDACEKRLCKIWDFHDGENSGRDLLGCDVV